jgi:hypothetical protein
MPIYRLFDENGRPCAQFECENERIPPIPEHLYIRDVPRESDFHTSRWDFEAEALAALPDRPTALHQFNYESAQWALPASATIEAIERKCADIEAEYLRRDVLPVMYQGVLFDADAKARANISGTSLKIMMTNALPNNWIGWRDYNNVQNWAQDDAATMLGHLAGIVNAIGDRQQALIAICWSKKDAVRQLTVLNDILAFPVETGWPS